MRELGHTEAGLDDELYMMDVWQEVELFHKLSFFMVMC